MTKGRLVELFEHLRVNPNDSFVKFGIAQEYTRLGDQKKALDYYQVLIKDDPGYVATYYHLGKLHEKMNNDDSAVHIYKRGMEVAARNGDGHALSELQKAYDNLEQEEEDDPEDY